MNVIQNGSLIIVPANVSDAVVYTCQANNQFGSSSHSVAVIVHCELDINVHVVIYVVVKRDTHKCYLYSYVCNYVAR